MPITDKNVASLQAEHTILVPTKLCLADLDRLRRDSGPALHFSPRRERKGKS
jgi:hypothetical protein